MKSSNDSQRHFVILQTGAVHENLRCDYLDYPAMFVRLFEQTGLAPERFSVIDVRQQALPGAVTADGYLITGSAHSVYDDLPWIAPLAQFVEQALRARRPVVGVCFGHQLLAHFFGGRVALSNAGWRVGVERCSLVTQPSWMPGQAHSADTEFSLLASHQDQVQTLPEGAQLLATSPQCPVAAFTMSHPGGGQALAIQGHPEFDKGYLRALMLEREQLLGPEVLAAGLASLEAPEHGVRVGTWMRQFLELGGDTKVPDRA